MSDKSKIEWTEATWNPVRGCSRVSEGCRHCYAERVAARFSGPGQAYEGFARYATNDAVPLWTGKVELIQGRLEDPLHWKRPRRIFVNSMSDLFHENLSDEQIDRVFAVMALCPQHTFQVLTKRPERMRDYICNREGWERLTERIFRTVSRYKLDETLLEDCIQEIRVNPAEPEKQCWVIVPLPNIWLGVSVEDQETADERIPWLLRTPAAIRWISYEPALGPVDFELSVPKGDCGYYCDEEHGHIDHRNIDWMVVGGESGPGARPFDVQWARNTVAQCKAAGVPVFVKQLGANPIYIASTGNGPLSIGYSLADRKGGDWNEWPEDLRVREYPR